MRTKHNAVMAKNTVCHIEWEVTDLDRAQSFFGGLFDWKFQSFGDTMVVFGTGEHHIGGLTKVETARPGYSPSVWIEVDDVEVYCAKARHLGGTVVSEKSPVPNVGWSATVADLDGNPVGLVEFEKRG
jgi:predicted enzyme related to lactoylglutathione lyase